MFVKEALDITIKYLDDAVLAGLPSVRILHGKGTGALRKAVQEELRDNPLVSKYQLAPFDQGGEGITVVTFKE
jgi:DNA mismatch repair protein MutS2